MAGVYWDTRNHYYVENSNTLILLLLPRKIENSQF